GRGATPDKMIVKWGTDGNADPGSVSFRLKGTQKMTTVSGPAARDHEVVLSGLGLDTLYEYSVTSGAAQSPTFGFGTCPAARAAATIRHVFVWFHHSAYSVGDHGDSASVQQSWVPLFADPKNKVTAVFSGHDHIYNRLSDGSPVVWVVSGGAGATLYGTSNA